MIKKKLNRSKLIIPIILICSLSNAEIINIPHGSINNHADANINGSIAWFFAKYGSQNTYNLTTPPSQAKYKIKNTLVMPENSVLTSDSKSIIEAAEQMRNLKANTNMISMHNGCKLYNLTIDANRNASIVVSALRRKDIEIKDCYLGNTQNYYADGFEGRSHIIHAWYTKGLTVKNSVLENAGCNPKISPRGWPGQASSIDARWGGDITVKNNIINYALGHGVTFSQAKNVTIHNNRIWNTGENARIPIGQTGDGIGAYHNGLGDAWLNWVITDNDIQFYGNHGIHISGRGIRIERNYISDGQYNAISIQDWREPHDDIYDVWVIDNYIGEHGTGNVSAQWRYPINVDMNYRPDGIVIKGTKGNTDVYWGDGIIDRNLNAYDTLTPVRRGIDGVRPFWNEYAFRFMYVPSFNFQTVKDASSYKFTAKSDDGQAFTFTASRSDVLLKPIWLDIPVGMVELKVEAVDKDGKVLGIAGERKFEKAAAYNGPYRTESYNYSDSAKKAMKELFKLDIITNWLETGKPHPDYQYRYQYASKMIGAVANAAAFYAGFDPQPENVDEVLKIGKAAADYLISIHFSADSPLEHFPPTYYDMEKQGHMDVNNFMVTEAVGAGNGYLSLYEATKEQKYFKAAQRIADGYANLQLDNGSWHQVLNVNTGEPVFDNIVNPQSIISYLSRFVNNYDREDFKPVIDKAIQWTFDNTISYTFNWQNQFEDSPPTDAYKNLSHTEANQTAVWLLNNLEKNPYYLEMAKELIRYVEDQFVVWSDPPIDSNREWDDAMFPAEYYSTDKWILPCVCEQYLFWQPVAASSTSFIRTLKEAYKVTGEDIYILKAKDLADSIVYAQQEHHNGQYLTYLTSAERDYWINCSVGTARVLKSFGEFLDNHPRFKND